MTESQDVEVLFKSMLTEHEEITKQDQIYQDDIKDFPLKVQWLINGLFGYQIFEKDNYSYKFGEKLEEPDITLDIADKEAARLLLTGEMKEYSAIPQKDYNEGFELLYTAQLESIITDEGKTKQIRTKKPFLTAHYDKDKNYHPFILLKLPIFRNLRKPDPAAKSYGVYVPINESLGNFDNKVLPMKIFKYFIDKACNIVMEDICGCRLVHECQHHDVSLACMHMGSATKNIDLEDLERDLEQNIPGRIATKEEALERVQLAYDNGLIPLLGRINSGTMLSMCFCCSCCCVNGMLLTHGSPSLSTFHRFDGLTVSVDEEKCVGCGDCLDVCVFKGIEMSDEKAKVNQERCLGCGRCEETCQYDAISISIDEPARVEELIKIIESYSDVS
jgi:UDP-glucose 4-epimerase